VKIDFGFRERLANFLLGDNYQQLNETLAQSEFNNEILRERLVDLELALEDANWMRLMFEGEHEFTREGLRKIVDLARIMWIKNPLIKRSVMVKALYIWAQGVNVKYKNPELNKILQAFWDDEKNKVELTGHQAQMEKQIDYEVISNIFFVFFTRPSDGRVRVRTVPFDEITDIICDPEDAKTTWFYVRKWNEKKLNRGTGRINTTRRIAYYPDWNYKPKDEPAKIGNVEVKWDTPVYHVKAGGMSGWKFGVSQIYAAIDWARAYKEFLEDVASLMRAYSKFAWKRTTKGGKKAIAAERAKMASTLASGGTSLETNPPPVTGAMAFLGEDTDLQPMQVRGASISPDDGRRLLLMVAAAVGLPETYYGDVSVGTFATAKTMDRPTELAMKEGQTTWTDILRNIFNFVMLQAMKATESTIKDLGKVVKTEDNGMVEEKIEWKNPLTAMLDIDFPPILEKDIQAAVQAIVTALTLNGQQLTLLDEQTATRLILKAIAEDDTDEIMAELFPEGESSVDRGASGEPTTSEAIVRAAAKKLIEAIQLEKVKASNNGSA
jgi:hypothetical protein